MKVLVTGTAGFIGYHLSNKLTSNGHQVIGVDEVNNYYDDNLKFDRLKNLGFENSIDFNVKYESTNNNSIFYRTKLEDLEAIHKIFENEKPDIAINLAAQAGVRYSLTNPHAYINANITGFLNILEGCRFNPVQHLIYASSSSVYGLNVLQPYSVNHGVDHPVSLYAASKKSNELMAHTYSHLYEIPTSGLRFFTVYGPWGRPDMALFIFTKSILEEKPIEVFNHGEMMRDFTYVDDIVENIYRLIPNAPQRKSSDEIEIQNPSVSTAPFKIYNIGNNSPVKLMDFVYAIEEATGKKAIIDFKDLQPGDVVSTYADVNSLIEVTGYKPSTNIKDGIRNFVSWFRDYYNI